MNPHSYRLKGRDFVYQGKIEIDVNERAVFIRTQGCFFVYTNSDCFLNSLFDEYYKDTCAIRKSDMIAFLQENSVYSLKDGIGECEATVQIYVGEKEKQSMKKSAKIIHEKLQDSFIQVLPNMYHGEFSINHADDYVRKLLEIVKRR